MNNQELLTERTHILMTKTQKMELTEMVKSVDMSQGEIIRAALDLFFEQQRANAEVGGEI